LFYVEIIAIRLWFLLNGVNAKIVYGRRCWNKKCFPVSVCIATVVFNFINALINLCSCLWCSGLPVLTKQYTLFIMCYLKRLPPVWSLYPRSCNINGFYYSFTNMNSVKHDYFHSLCCCQKYNNSCWQQTLPMIFKEINIIFRWKVIF